MSASLPAFLPAASATTPHTLRAEAPSASSPTPALARWAQWQDLSDTLTRLICQPFQAGSEQAMHAPGQYTATPTSPRPFGQAIGHAARTLIELTWQDPDVAIFHMVHATPEKMRRYSVLHAMHTGMLLALIGRRKDWGDARTTTAVLAALTMNLSIAELQNELAQQGTPLTAAQRQLVEAHPLASAQMLRDLGVQDEEWLTAVAQHHEQADGKGYPKGLIQLNMLADAIHTCDVFGAKVSPRAGRSGMASPRAAADIFRQSSAGYFGATIVRELGLYPPGCLVTLSSGELAVVVQRTRDPKSPDVVLLSDAAGQPLAQPQRANARSGAPGQGQRHIVGTAPGERWPTHLALHTLLALN
jgi:HD-GYP domain-containing protein (c-di-GMP phosphodiesterase class II)